MHMAADEIEKQRPGENKATKVVASVIESAEYRRKFDQITTLKKLSRLMCQQAKEILRHRSGTLLEDMVWIDLDTIEVVAEEKNGLTDGKIEYSGTTRKIVATYHNLLTMHSHPNSMPPSVDDLNSSFEKGYQLGVVLCHNGQIYVYQSEEFIEPDYFMMVVAQFKKRGYNEAEAQLAAIRDAEEHFDIRVWEVTDDGDDAGK